MGSRNGKVGLLIFSSTPPEELASVARSVEQAGFDEVWIPEDYFFIGGPTSAAIALGATEKIPVGIGVLSSVVRHPAVTAMEVATLARAYPGRITLGIGHGVPVWVAQMGLTPKSPLGALRAAVQTIDGLLSGKAVTGEHGPFVFDGVKLVHPATEPVKLMTGVIGPKSLELSGEIADGTVMSVIAGARYLEYARGHIATGAAKSGREAEAHEVPVFAIYHVDTDGAKARATAREALAFYLQAVGPTPMTGVYGINDELQTLLALGDLAKIAEQIPEEWLDWFTVAGTPEECVARIADLHEAGATSVILSPYPPDDVSRMVELTAAEVLPAARQKG